MQILHNFHVSVPYTIKLCSTQMIHDLHICESSFSTHAIRIKIVILTEISQTTQIIHNLHVRVSYVPGSKLSAEGSRSGAGQRREAVLGPVRQPNGPPKSTINPLQYT